MLKFTIKFLFCALYCASLLANTKLAADVKNVILHGRIVTMNQASEVIENGYVWVNDGVIVAVSTSQNALNIALHDAKADAKAIPIVHVKGDILPGMIDLHNHPEYAIYPLLPITRKYKDRYEWRFYDDDYQRRITHLNTLMTQAQYFDLGTEVGRYGELKALVGGTTSLQGSRPTMAYSREECLVRNIETSPVTTRLAFSRVDIGRDAQEWQRMAEEKAKGMMAIHLAEGVGPRMASEFEALKRSALLGAELIAIHGVGLTAPQFRELAEAKAKLVWSPLSNFMLYGQTANIIEARRAGVNISLAPDWAPSGSKSILGELKVADLVNKHALNQLFSDKELVEMVTVNPAAAMGWQGRLGRIAPGYLADMIVVDRTVNDPYRNLINTIEENIKLVMVRGEVLYGDALLVRTFRHYQALESLPPIANRSKVIAPNCANSALPVMSVEDTMTRLQQGLNLNTAYMAKRVSIEQFTRDFLICNLGKPNDPPTSDDAKKLLQCRFQLPFEETILSPLITNSDNDFFKRLMVNPNLPSYLQALPNYYGARRVTAQVAPVN
jgi:5-methylthioadenosine/S-adenosylhomocysteine deaminase